MSGVLHDDRREHLVRCAKKAFADKGFYSTSISQIVQDAGIARGTFYQYFDNKLHIFQIILDSFLQDLRDSIKPISLAPGAPPPLAQTQGNLTRVLSLVLSERHLTQILLSHAGTPDRVLVGQLDDFYKQVAEMLERSLRLGISMNLVRPCNTRLTAYSIIGAVKEVIFQLTSSQEPQPPMEELVREILGFGMTGILAGSQAALLESTQQSGRSEARRNPMRP